ncbi:MAG: hypothetical protein ABJF04_03425 [Reichenbachiella sp.]|uniref:hypothetical protein n=1 Tax=Reichenbachiella sp. TaxID=2184521 RepID=UPI003264DBEB
MKPIFLTICTLAVMSMACSDEDAIPVPSNTNPDFLSNLEPHEETVVNLTQAEALDLWANQEAKLVSVIKPETAIRRWWKAFSLTFEPDGDYVYATIEDDIIPAAGSWAFAQPSGVDVVLFNKDEEKGELFERFATVTFKTSATGRMRFEMKINIRESSRYSPAFVGEWIYIFQL